MQKEISNVSDIMNYVESSRDSYDCKISNGLALKKRGSVKFKTSEQEKLIKVVVRKMSGNGEFTIDEQVFTATQSDVEYSLTNSSIDRPASAVGAVSIIKLVFEVADVVEPVVETVVETAKTIETVETVKPVEPAEIAKAVEIAKEVEVIEVAIKEEVVPEVVEEKIVEEKIVEEKVEIVSSEVKYIDVVDVDVDVDVEEVIEPVTAEVSFTPVCYYSGKASKFNTLIRKIGNYSLLTSKNDKIVLIMSGSEVHIPVSIGSVNYVKIAFTAKSISRNTTSVQIGLRGERVELAEVNITNKPETYIACLKVDSTFNRSQLVFVTSRVDSVNLFDLNLVSCSEADYNDYQTQVAQELAKRSSQSSARDKISSPKFFFVTK